MFIKNKVIVKLFKGKDSNEICLLKKRLLSHVLKVKIPVKQVDEKKGYCEAF